MIRDVAADAESQLSGAAIDKARKQQRARHRKHATQIRSVANRIGVSDPTIYKWSVGYAEIVREATSFSGVKGYYGETTWRLISGLTHPSLMRATSHSNVQEIADNGDGTLNALITTDLGLTRMAFEAAWLNTKCAIDLFGQRKIRPADSDQYPDATNR